jgi:demethylmenaquinone methyltransferase/2-methoxy-6-polyprenyl-1,4-benzoquinol methylase
MNDRQSEYLRRLLVTAGLREPPLRAAIRALQLAPASRGLDVGCGAGLQCVLLARQVGPGGHVTGLDPAPEFLEHGRALVHREGLADRISLKRGSAQQLPFEDHRFDWAWSADCVGYGPWDAGPMLREMIRVVRPGGTIAILAWSSERVLPGFPRLEARLQATSAGMAPFRDDMPPGEHFPRFLGVLRRLGLVDLQARTFAGTAHAPLDRDSRLALEALFEMRWPGAQDELPAEDRAQFLRLCQPASGDFILDHPDYYAFFTYSMFSGRTPETAP